MNTIRFFDIDQQLAIFDDSKGPSQVEQWQDKVLDFFASQGRFSPEEVKKIRGSGYINGTFLKMAAELHPRKSPSAATSSTSAAMSRTS